MGTSLVIKNPPCNTADVGSIPGGTKIPHASGQLSQPTATTEPTYSTAPAPQRKILHDAAKV